MSVGVGGFIYRYMGLDVRERGRLVKEMIS